MTITRPDKETNPSCIIWDSLDKSDVAMVRRSDGPMCQQSDVSTVRCLVSLPAKQNDGPGHSDCVHQANACV